MERPPVFDLAAAAEALREEALITLAFVGLARQALRGVAVPPRLRSLLAQAERAARKAREQARQIDDALRAAGGNEGGPSA